MKGWWLSSVWSPQPNRASATGSSRHAGAETGEGYVPTSDKPSPPTAQIAMARKLPAGRYTLMIEFDARTFPEALDKASRAFAKEGGQIIALRQKPPPKPE